MQEKKGWMQNWAGRWAQGEKPACRANAAPSLGSVPQALHPGLLLRSQEDSPQPVRAMAGSVVLLVADRLAFPAHALEQIAIRLDHLVQAADIGLDVGPSGQSSLDVVLHVAAPARPIWAPSTERGEVVKIGALGGQAHKFLVIVNVSLKTAAINQPELLALVSRVLPENPAQHGAKGSDSSAGGNKDRIPQGRTQDEIAEWPLAGELLAFSHITQEIGHEAVRHAVE